MGGCTTKEKKTAKTFQETLLNRIKPSESKVQKTTKINYLTMLNGELCCTVKNVYFEN